MKSESEDTEHRKVQILLHDLFNIGTLSYVCYLVGKFLFGGTDIEALRTLLNHYWTNRNSNLHLISDLMLTPGMMDSYHQIFYAISAYLVIDVLWVLIIPRCVPSSPKAIVIHHIATAVLLAATFFVALNNTLLVLQFI